MRRVEFSESPAGFFWPPVLKDGGPQDSIAGTGEEISVNDTSGAEPPARFYRIAVC